MRSKHLIRAHATGWLDQKSTLTSGFLSPSNGIPFDKKLSLRTVFAGVYKKERTQLTFTCSNSTKETVEKVIKYVQS